MGRGERDDEQMSKPELTPVEKLHALREKAGEGNGEGRIPDWQVDFFEIYPEIQFEDEKPILDPKQELKINDLYTQAFPEDESPLKE